MKRLFIFLILLFVLLVGCKTEVESNIKSVDKLDLIECSVEIRRKALDYAIKYKEADTEYEWGGQDPLRAIKIDCSGLVIRCYEYALQGNSLYKLPFSDTTVKNLYNEFSFKIDNPTPGDLVFMGEENSDKVTHIGIFVKIDENDNVYFIDSTLKDSNGDGIDDINGVTERFYKKNDKKIKSYGIMSVVKI